MTALLATLTSTLLLASAPALVAGYGSGAPAGSCDTMKPGPPHGENQVAEKDRDPAPFNLEAELQDNGQVKVFLRTNKEAQKFRGFLVMAEADGDRGHGYFIPAKDSLDLVKAVNCASLPASCEEEDSCQGTSNAMTHNSGAEKEAVTLIWTPPSKFSGKVKFVATVVGQNSGGVSTWWENIKSSAVSVKP